MWLIDFVLYELQNPIGRMFFVVDLFMVFFVYDITHEKIFSETGGKPNYKKQALSRVLLQTPLALVAKVLLIIIFYPG